MRVKLIVGIGNPDPHFTETRHNVGWQFLDWLKKKFQAPDFELHEKLNAEATKAELDGIKAWLIKPTTYVNESGKAVAAAKKWLKIKNEDIIVIQDDLDIPFGHCKLSYEKNSGGHRGIESIIQSLKTTKFYRVRIGIGIRALDKARRQSDATRNAFVKNYVLKKFTPSERITLKKVFQACEVRLLQAGKL